MSSSNIGGFYQYSTSNAMGLELGKKKKKNNKTESNTDLWTSLSFIVGEKNVSLQRDKELPKAFAARLRVT